MTGRPQCADFFQLPSYYRIVLLQKLQRRLDDPPEGVVSSFNSSIMDAADIISFLTEDAVTHLEPRQIPSMW
jgi:hypothetical protein